MELFGTAVEALPGHSSLRPGCVGIEMCLEQSSDFSAQFRKARFEPGAA